MNSYRNILFGIVAALAITSPALAGQTPWVEIGPGSRIRLISNDTQVDGVTLAAIEIDMPPTTKTYWRIPGETGIPLLLDIGASKGISSAEIRWPYPERVRSGGFLDFVYHGPTVLPVEIEIDGKAARLDAGLILGVCDEICVPVRLTLSLDLNFDKSDAAQGFRLKQAMADVPMSWTDGTPPVSTVSVDEMAGRIDVAYTPGSLDPSSIIIDTGKAIDLFSLPQKSPEPGVVSFQLLDAAGIGDIGGSEMTVTFLTIDGVFELTRIVQPVVNSQGD